MDQTNLNLNYQNTSSDSHPTPWISGTLITLKLLLVSFLALLTLRHSDQISLLQMIYNIQINSVVYTKADIQPDMDYTTEPTTIVQQDIAEQLSQVDWVLKQALKEFQSRQNRLIQQAKIQFDNNHTLLTVFAQIGSVSFKPIESLLRFLDDKDILNLASSCQTIYKLVYSPLGYRITRYLRPVMVNIRREGSMPTYNKLFLENLCNDISFAGMDEDDKIAIVQTMKTNLMAARQKMREIQLCNQQWDRRKDHLKSRIGKIGREREEENKQIELILEQKQKLLELLKESSNNIARLKDSQERMLEEREKRKKELELEKTKLTRQKELLIKKIKAQQKEREEGLVYARQVARITTMLNQLTKK